MHEKNNKDINTDLLQKLGCLEFFGHTFRLKQYKLGV